MNLACGNDHDHDVSFAGEVVSVVKEPSTCEAMGITAYSVSGMYGGFQYSSEKDVQDIPAAHSFLPFYAWSDDRHSCTVTMSCTRDHSHDVSFAADVTSSVLTPATYSTMGFTRYTVSGTYEGVEYHDVMDVQDIQYIPRQESGVGVYEETLQPKISTDLTSLFTEAKGNGGKVEVTAATTVGDLTISFDRNAVGSIGGSDVSLSVNAENASNPKWNTVMVIEIDMKGASFPGGTATLTFDFDKVIPAGKEAKVYFVDGDRREDMHGVFANGRMTFTTSHFSTYEVVFEDITDNGRSDDDGKGGLPLGLIIGGGVAVLALIAIVVILIRRRA